MAVPSANGTAAASGRGPLGALDSQPWVEKYRPKTLDDVAAHKDIIDTSEPPAGVPVPLVCRDRDQAACCMFAFCMLLRVAAHDANGFGTPLQLASSQIS